MMRTTFEQFIESVVPDGDARARVQQLVGVVMLGSREERTAALGEPFENSGTFATHGVDQAGGLGVG